MSYLNALLCLGAIAIGADVPEDFTLLPPPGKYLAAGPENAAGPTFPSKSPLVATSYFYWYDADSKAHVLNGDGTDALTDHPPTLAGFSYKSVDWHAQQLADMMAAGIDVLLPVYWGTPLGEQHWSDEGLPPLVAARERLLSAGQTPPAIGMFYDTSTLQYNEARLPRRPDDRLPAACGSTARSATSGARSRPSTGPGSTASRWCSCTPRPSPGEWTRSCFPRSGRCSAATSARTCSWSRCTAGRARPTASTNGAGRWRRSSWTRPASDRATTTRPCPAGRRWSASGRTASSTSGPGRGC